MYLKYINLFRAIATLFVVFNHCIHGLQWGSGYDNLEMSRLMKIVFSNGAFFFVFIAGFIFQHLLYKFDYGKYLKTRFLLVILPYLIISIPAVFAWTFLFEKSAFGVPRDLYQQPWWYISGYYFATGQHMAPLWFIPMITMFYVLSPLFKLLDRFPVVYLSIPLLMWISYVYPRTWSPAWQFVHFFPVYIIGMWASHYKDQVLRWAYRLRYLLFAAFLGFVAYELLMTRYVQSYFNYMNKLCLSFLIIALLSHYSENPYKWLTWFAVINFSVFFLHTYANAGLKIIFTGGPAQSLPVVGNPAYQVVYFSVVVGISIAATLLVKKITGKYSKNLIGA
jgi:peptidoglycan/LPS O-acetylase OafA/YrhL